MSIPKDRIEELLRQELEQRYPHEREVILRLPGRLDGDGAFAKLVYSHNMPAQIKEPGVDGNPCWLVIKRGTIRIERAWLTEAADLGTSISWRLLPRLRRGGYLTHFDDDEMTVSALPPKDASPEEIETMRHALTGDEVDAARQRSASLRWAVAAQAQHPEIKAGTRQRPVTGYEHMHAQGVGPTRPQPLNVPNGTGGYEVVSTTPRQAAELGRAAADMARLDGDVAVVSERHYEQIEARLDQDLAEQQGRQRARELLDLASTHAGATALADLRARQRRGRKIRIRSARVSLSP